ncbi:MAG: hypothetical protein IKF36_01785 [Bacilli bacterium]|nr:hypothetical protein [Bacilli bacterium]
MFHIKLDLYIKNNDEEFNYKDIDFKTKNNKYLFSIENDEYEIDLDKLVFHKKNSESELDFIFDIKNKTTGTYLIKELEFYMDAKVETTKVDRRDKDLDIEYKLWLQDEYVGEFIFRIKVKE